MRKFFGTAALLSFLVIGGQAIGQQPTNDATRTANQAAPARAATADEQLAAVMLASCRNEVEIAKAAKDSLKSSEAKEFAERMIKDHGAACDRLEKLAGQHYHRASAARTAPENNNANGTNEQRAKLELGRFKVEAARSTTNAATQAGGLDWVAIHQQIADQCLASAKSELQKAESKNVDECYIGFQIAAHAKMVDCLKVFQQYASTNMRTEIDRSLEMAQSHLKEAKSTMESLAKDSRKSKD